MRTVSPLQVTVGWAAILFPLLHSLSDALEWEHGGFSMGQLWLNYVAFLPMSWLLLGLYAVHRREPGWLGLMGAIVYGAAFTYFCATTVYALQERIPDYATLWTRMQHTYTWHGGLMVGGGLLFAVSLLQAQELPRGGVLLFAAGVLMNLLVWLLPVAEILQTLGSLMRNAGLIWLGCGVLRAHSLRRRDAVV